MKYTNVLNEKLIKAPLTDAHMPRIKKGVVSKILAFAEPTNAIV